jgi:hypothetical protein
MGHGCLEMNININGLQKTEGRNAPSGEVQGDCDYGWISIGKADVYTCGCVLWHVQL